jgi:DNA-damage-inducible protein J
MSTDSVVRARIDSEIKKKADEVFKHRGISASAAIRVFFSTVASTGALPPSFNIPNEETAASIRDGRAGLGVSKYSDASGMFAAFEDDVANR